MEYCTELYSYNLKTDASILKREDDLGKKKNENHPYLNRKYRKRYECWKLANHQVLTISLIIPLPKKRNTRLCQNYRTISLVCHPSKVMLRVILNRLVNQTEQIWEEEHVGFASQSSTTEHIVNMKLLVKKHFEHQMQLYHRNRSIVSGTKGCGDS